MKFPERVGKLALCLKESMVRYRGGQHIVALSIADEREAAVGVPFQMMVELKKMGAIRTCLLDGVIDRP